MGNDGTLLEWHNSATKSKNEVMRNNDTTPVVSVRFDSDSDSDSSRLLQFRFQLQLSQFDSVSDSNSSTTFDSDSDSSTTFDSKVVLSLIPIGFTKTMIMYTNRRYYGMNWLNFRCDKAYKLF